MERFVHHQFRSAVIVTCCVVCGMGLGTAVHGLRSLAHVSWWALGVAGWGVVAGVLEAALPIPRVADVWDFRHAAPVQEPASVVRPSFRDALADRYYVPMHAVFGVPTVALGALDPWASCFALSLAGQWAVRGAVGVWWERRHGLLLWRRDPLAKGPLLSSSPLHRPAGSMSDISGTGS